MGATTTARRTCAAVTLEMPIWRDLALASHVVESADGVFDGDRAKVDPVHVVQRKALQAEHAQAVLDVPSQSLGPVVHREDRLGLPPMATVGRDDRVVAARQVGTDGVLQPTLVVDATPDMSVCGERSSGRSLRSLATTISTVALRLVNDTRYRLPAGVFTADISKALLAARTLDFGGVLVNEVPTWRADQQPYGGLLDSGNTREGPAWSIRDMTEERLVVLCA